MTTMIRIGFQHLILIIFAFVSDHDFHIFSSALLTNPNAFAVTIRTSRGTGTGMKRSRLISRVANVIPDTIAKDTIGSKTGDKTSTETGTTAFENFDYEDHWYPCIWEEDLEPEEPTKVTIFDVDYVVSKTPSGEIVAMKDYCTHKGAALSEGRMTASGYFQCAYHGWSFDGKNGDCVEIPQIVRRTEDGGQTSATIPSKACTTAVPAMIHQGMVWLFPGGNLEKALLAPAPPSVPNELASTLKLTTYVRDMPIDFSILLSNICDPDHGLFAHQATGFDLYAASIDCGFESFVSEETDGGKGWSLRTKVDAKDKLLEMDRSFRNTRAKTAKTKSKDPATNSPWATFNFHAPTHVRMNRVDKETGETKFASLFYVCPVGVGRSRFMAGVLAGMKFPRWVYSVGTSDFLDQDTYLLATQQGKLLAKEADDLREAMKESGIDRDDTEGAKGLGLKTRTRSFVLPSPTDKIGSRIERFWDATLSRCPNRVQHLLKLDESGAFLQTPSREFVLDRKAQILDISKDARGAVRNSKRTKRIGLVLSIALVIGKMVSLSARPSGPLSPILRTAFLIPTLTGLSLTTLLADKFEKQYYFKYTDDHRKADLKKIPKKMWLDRVNE